MNNPIKTTKSTCASDGSLVEDIAQVDSDQQIVSNSLFVETVKKNYSMYLRKCFAYVKCHAIAEDAVQEGILAAHLNLASVKKKEALAAWIYRIVVRKAIDLLHKKRRLVLLEDNLEELVSYNKHGLLNEPMWAEMLNPEEEILKNEGVQQVKNAVESLEDVYRIPILLKDFEGFSIREIANILKISESNTKVRIHRARIKLKNELKSFFSPDDVKKSR